MKLSLIVSSLGLALVACASEAEEVGTGTVDVRVYGESFIEEGIAARDVNDGWAIEFERFAVSIGEVQVAGETLAESDAVDVAVRSAGTGHSLGSLSAPAGEHEHPSFTIERVEVVGSAERDGTTKTFAWTFTEPTHYAHCDTRTKVERDETATFQITIHADHLFYDSLVAEEPLLLFDAIADADTDADGEVTQAELSAADIGGYDPGNEEVEDLWAWLVAQHGTLGHVDGEGHCDATARD